jgi:hypothetical protein
MRRAPGRGIHYCVDILRESAPKSIAGQRIPTNRHWALCGHLAIEAWSDFSIWSRVALKDRPQAQAGGNFVAAPKRAC